MASTKEKIRLNLEENGYRVLDLGTNSEDSGLSRLWKITGSKYFRRKC